MSPQYNQDTASIHLKWVRYAAAVKQAVREIEKVLEPFHPLPRSGNVICKKVVTRLYARHSDFFKLRTRLDPSSKFANPWLDTVAHG